MCMRCSLPDRLSGANTEQTRICAHHARLVILTVLFAKHSTRSIQTTKTHGCFSALFRLLANCCGYEVDRSRLYIFFCSSVLTGEKIHSATVVAADKLCKYLHVDRKQGHSRVAPSEWCTKLTHDTNHTNETKNYTRPFARNRFLSDLTNNDDGPPNR